MRKVFHKDRILIRFGEGFALFLLIFVPGKTSYEAVAGLLPRKSGKFVPRSGTSKTRPVFSRNGFCRSEPWSAGRCTRFGKGLSRACEGTVLQRFRASLVYELSRPEPGTSTNESGRMKQSDEKRILGLLASLGVGPEALDEPSLLVDALRRAHRQISFYRETVLHYMEESARLEQENERMACRLAWLEEAVRRLELRPEGVRED